MIASVAFQNFKALRSARLELGPFNLVIGPNGSGKSSVIQAIEAAGLKPGVDIFVVSLDGWRLKYTP